MPNGPGISPRGPGPPGLAGALPGHRNLTPAPSPPRKVILTMRLPSRRGRTLPRRPAGQSSHPVSIRVREATQARVTAGKAAKRHDSTGAPRFTKPRRVRRASVGFFRPRLATAGTSCKTIRAGPDGPGTAEPEPRRKATRKTRSLRRGLGLRDGPGPPRRSLAAPGRGGRRGHPVPAGQARAEHTARRPSRSFVRRGAPPGPAACGAHPCGWPTVTGWTRRVKGARAPGIRPREMRQGKEGKTPPVTGKRPEDHDGN
jgi:hypothetical protein